MKQLRAAVERVVAPLHASPWRKDRMREELLAHLSNLYDDELSKLSEPLQALEKARSRFGDPAELTRSLQESVPTIERVVFTPLLGFHWQARRPGESVHAHILRTACYATAWIAVANVFLIGVIAAIGQLANRRPLPEKPPLVNVAAFLALCAIVQIVSIVVLPLCCELVHCQAALYKTSRGRQRAIHATLVAAGLSAAAAVGGVAAALITGAFGPLMRISIVTPRQFWLVVAVAAAVMFLLSIIQSWQQARASRQFDDLHADQFELAE